MVGLSCQIGNEASSLCLDAVSWVGGAAINSWGTGGTPSDSLLGVMAWFGQASVFGFKGGSVVKQLVSGDISGGNVTVRLRYRTLTAANKVLNAATTNVLQFWATNLRQP